MSFASIQSQIRFSPHSISGLSHAIDHIHASTGLRIRKAENA